MPFPAWKDHPGTIIVRASFEAGSSPASFAGASLKHEHALRLSALE